MASPGAIISGAKSIPGAARPTPAPQGLSPVSGRLSPLAAQLDTGGSGNWGAAYQTALPRPPEDFTNGAFGPFSPIYPVPVDAPEPGTDMPEPRLWQYEVGWNLPVGQPGSEGVKLADFSTLRSLADLYSVARAAIQLRKAEVRGLEWDIVPTKEAAKALRADHAGMRDFGERRAKALKFFRKPDPDYFNWSSFIDAFLEEVLVFDALSLLIRKKWVKGRGKGLLGSDLDSLSLINGPTIRPLLGMHGERPRPPAPAYQQYLYGVPRCDLMTLVTGRDLEEQGLPDSAMKAFRSDQLLYVPMVPRRWTPYGFPPIERALVPVMAGLQKQGYQLDFFREGSIPGMFVSPGAASNMTPNQIRELQDALNAIAGDPAWKHKIIVLPTDSQVMPQKPVQLADQFDEVVMNQVCMAFDVQPMELGIMPKVSTTVSPGAANQMAKSSQSSHERKATKPTLSYIADIMNVILQDVAGQDDMSFTFEGLEENEDEETLTTLIVAQVSAGLRSIDEGREQLGLLPWGLPETSDPGWATATGFTPLGVETDPSAVAEAPGAPGDPSQEPPGPQAPLAVPSSSGANGAASPGHAAAQGGSSRATGSNPVAKPTGAPAAKPTGQPAKIPASTHKVPPSTPKVPTKAVASEFDALARHLRKGRDISTWERKYLPAHTLEILTEDLGKGLTVDEAVAVAKSTLPADNETAPAVAGTRTVRRAGLNGQEYWEPLSVPHDVGAAGGGGPVMVPHDANDIQHLGKGADDLSDPNPVEAEHVKNQLRRNYPEKALGWVDGVRWIGPVLIPQDRIDYDDVKAWSASKDKKRVKHFVQAIRDGDSHLHPAVAVQEPGENRVKIIDGHHRSLAYRKLDQPVKAYVGFVDSNGGPWDQTHSYQFHQGSDPANKADHPQSDLPIAAGLVIQAADTKRILMLQRSPNPTNCPCGQRIEWDDLDGWQHADGSISHEGSEPGIPRGASVSDLVGTDHDPAGGHWEFPGGCLEPGEGAAQAAFREWSEETGLQPPAGIPFSGWRASNGKYQGFVFIVPSEDGVLIHDGRDQVVNPDDPDGDRTESVAWWDPEHLIDNPAIRPELAADLDLILAALAGSEPTNGGS